MARNRAGDAPFAAFGTMLDTHLRAGTRPDPSNREPWTDTAFAQTQTGRGTSLGVSPRSVANWRKGVVLPSAIEPILTALFGPLRQTGGAERQALRTAYDEARKARDLRVISAAKPDPAGEIFQARGDHLAINRTPAPDDIAAATDPATQADHAGALALIRRLAALVERRGNSLTAAWDDLLPTTRSLLRILDGPTAALPEQAAMLHDLSIALGSLLEQDGLLRGLAAAGRPEPGEDALPVDLRRLLGDAVTRLAVLTRAFPSNRQRDARVRDFWRPEDVPAAARASADAQAEAVIAAEDASVLQEIERAARRPGVQGTKAGGRLVTTMRNLVLAGAMSVVLSGYANESPLVKRVSAFLVRAEDMIGTLVSGMPSDFGSAIRSVVDRLRDNPAGKALPHGAPPEPRRDEEPPYDPDEAKRMILAGHAPPLAWVPLIRELNFDGDALRDLLPLAGLTSLERLTLSNTQVSDLAQLAKLTSLRELHLAKTQVRDLGDLAGLTNMQVLDLNGVQLVTNLWPLAGLINLERLILDHAEVRDLAPLAGLANLRHLSLAVTRVRDLGPLSQLAALQTLSLEVTEVSDLAPLAGLIALEHLWLNGFMANDLSPLIDLPRLTVHWRGDMWSPKDYKPKGVPPTNRKPMRPPPSLLIR